MGQLSSYTNTFTAGTKAKASEVNTNFTEIKTAHNATDAELPTYTNGSRLIASNSGKTAMEEITATTTEANYLSGVTSAIQTQLNTKPASTAVVLLDGSQNPTGIITYNSDLSGSMSSGSNQIPSIKWVEDNMTSGSKEYGLALTNGTDTSHDIDIAAGLRYDSLYTTAISLATGITIAIDASGALGLDTGTVANSTQYYIWLCSGTSGTTGVFSISATTPTLPAGYDTYKACIGRVITDGSANIDNTQLWVKHPDSTESYKYQQASGNFPNADVTITHSLGSTFIEYYITALHNSNGKSYPVVSWYQTSTTEFSSSNGIEIVDSNGIILKKMNAFEIPSGASSFVAISNSVDYKLKIVIRTRLV